MCVFYFQLERLQAENAAEWGKRERLETDKISLERENKKLRNEVRELQERMESRRGRPVSTVHMDSQQLQQELADRNKVRQAKKSSIYFVHNIFLKRDEK